MENNEDHISREIEDNTRCHHCELIIKPVERIGLLFMRYEQGEKPNYRGICKDCIERDLFDVGRSIPTGTGHHVKSLLSEEEENRLFALAKARESEKTRRKMYFIFFAFAFIFIDYFFVSGYY